MEGFCLDVQRIILKEICGPHHRVYHLRRLYCVNHMFRRWVGRYAVDTVDKQEFLTRVCDWLYAPATYCDLFVSWNVFDTLSKQWSKKGTLLSSFVICLDTVNMSWGIRPRISRKAVDSLFFNKDSILRDMKRRAKHEGIRRVQEREMEKRQNFVDKYTSLVAENRAKLEKNTEKRDAAQEAIEELESKYKKQKK